MSDKKHILSRRQFAGGALAGASLIVAGGARAQERMALTPDQPIGPFYPVARLAEVDADLTWLEGHSQRASGTVIEVTGRVLDRAGRPVDGAVLELWQCNAAGRYAHPGDAATTPLDPHFQGYAAIRTDAGGNWKITTVKPAGYGSPIGMRTPHIHFDIRGKAHRLITQMYFPEDAATNAKDLLYKDMGGAAVRTVARADGVARYGWDIVLMEG